MAITKTQGNSVWTIMQARWLNKLFGEVDAASAASASFTIGTEATDVINVAVELQDAAGTAIDAVQNVTVFLSDAATGLGITATAPDSGWAEGTDGAIIGEITANKCAIIQTEADGTFDLDLEESGAGTWYMVVVLPNGKQSVSSAITFAA